MRNSNLSQSSLAACIFVQPGHLLRDSLAECDSSGEAALVSPLSPQGQLCPGKGWDAAATDPQGAQAEAVGAPEEDEFPLRHSKYEPALIRKLIFCLKGPSEINTDSRPFLLGHRQAGLSAGSVTQQGRSYIHLWLSLCWGISKPLSKTHDRHFQAHNPCLCWV